MQPQRRLILSLALAAAVLYMPRIDSAAADAPATRPATQPAALDVPPELAREIDGLLPQLAARDYRVRDKACDRLIEIGPIAKESLARYARGSDSPEGRNNADLALRQIAENERLGPTFMSLQLRDGTIEEACAALSRAAPAVTVAVTTEPGPAWPHASVDLRHRPYWEVVRRTCEAFGAAPRLDLNHGRVTLVPDPAWGKRPWRLAAGCLVVFDSAERIARRDAELDVDVNEQIRLRFVVYTDPAYRGLTHLHYLEIAEAIDEHGQSLIPDKPLFQGVGSGPGSFSFETGVIRRPNQKGGLRLASFKGKAGLLVQTQAARIEFDGLPAIKEITHAAAGVRLTVHSVERRPDGWAVNVGLLRDGCDDRVWDMARYLFNPLPLELCDKEGKSEVWVLQGGGRDEAPNRVERSVVFLDTGGPDAAATREPPAKLVWVLPAKTAEVTIPFEFTDLPLP